MTTGVVVSGSVGCVLLMVFMRTFFELSNFEQYIKIAVMLENLDAGPISSERDIFCQYGQILQN